jgi:UDP-glucuronate 4-epimerase
MKVLITGTAGFIGFFLARRLIEEGHEVIGVDGINDYYDIGLKYARLEVTGIKKEAIQYGVPAESTLYPNYNFVKVNLEDQESIAGIFQSFSPDAVVHLAAQAGVRYSITNPDAYIQSNIVGTMNILEACRHHSVGHLVYASSSSVYGLNEKMPFSVHDNVDHPISLYAASKKSNELMAHTYSHLYKVPTTGLRFFTVYGPWGRPDMALFIFTRSILSGEPIDVYNHGHMERDFTYVDDIVGGIIRILEKPPEPSAEWNGLSPDPSRSVAPYRLYNIGNNNPVKLMDFIKAIETATGKEATINYMPIQPGDVEKTWADTSDLMKDFDYRPDTPIKDGVRKFVDWYREFYNT